MAERILYCKDICPLPKGNADRVENIGINNLLIKKVIKDGKEIGYTSVMSYPGITTNDLQIDDSSIACSDMKDCFDFVLRQSHGGMNGVLKCKYTIRTDRACGISSHKSDQAPDSIEV